MTSPVARRLLTVVCLLSCLLLVTQSFAAPLTKVRFQMSWKHQFEFAGYYAAKAQGYYADEGLDVDIRELESGETPLQEVLSGRAQFGHINSEIVLNRLQGEPVVLVANFFKVSPLVLVTSPDILSPNDLRGKRVMASANELQSAPFLAMFSYFNVSPRDFQVVPHSWSIDDFKQGKVDAVSVFSSNEMYFLRRDKVPHNVLNPASYGANAYDSNIFTSEQVMTADPTLSARFVRASIKGWQYAFAHKEEMVDLILNHYSTRKSRDALLFEANELERLTLHDVFPLGSVDPRRIDNLADLYISSGQAPANAKDRLLGFVQTPFSNISLSAEEQRYLQQHPVLRVGYSTRAPFSMFGSGEAQGFDIDYVQLLARELGSHLQFSEFAPEDLNQALQQQRIDIALNSGRLPEDGSLQQLPAYASFTLGLVTRANMDPVSSLEALQNKRLALLDSVYDAERLGRYFPAIHFVSCTDVSHCLQLVSRGQADAALGAMPILQYATQLHLYPNLSAAISLHSPLLEVENEQLSLKSDAGVLASLLQKAADNLIPQQLNQLQKRWISNLGSIDKALFTDADRQYIQQHNRVSYCSRSDWAPYDSQSNGSHQGVSADLLALFSSRLHLDFQFYPTASWSAALAALQDGKCDLLLSAIDDPAMQASGLRLTAPYLSIPVVIATRTEQHFVDNLSGVGNQPLAVLRNSPTMQALSRSQPQLRLFPVSSMQEGLRLVENKEVFGMLGGTLAIARAIQQGNFVNLKIAGSSDQRLDLHFALRSDEDALLGLLQRAITSLDSDSGQQARNRIMSSWNQVRFDQRIDYRLVWQVLAIFTLIALLLAWRQHSLHRSNRLLQQAHDELRQANASIAVQNQRLEQLSSTDALTGLFNRMKTDQLASSEAQLAELSQQPLSVILLDVDHFKMVNDRFGHPMGDKVLKEIATVLRRHSRDDDLVGRWGGEEFIVLCPHTSAEHAIALAERLCQLIAAHSYPHRQPQTASFGIATRQPGEAVTTTLARADQALYQAKSHGRNRVEFATPPFAPQPTV